MHILHILVFLRGTPGCSGVQEGSLSLFLQAKPDSPGEKGEVPAESHRLFFVRQTLRPRATFDPSQAARQVGVPQGPGNEQERAKMKVVACNWKEWAETQAEQDDNCRYIMSPGTLPAGEHWRVMFYFSDWLTVLFGPEETVEHAEWMRVAYSLVAILIALVCVFLPVRKQDTQVSLTLGALSFPVFSLVALRFCEAFPAPSFTTLYLVLTLAANLSGWLSFVLWRFDHKVKSVTNALYVFLGSGLFVLFLSGMDGHWPYIGMDIGSPPTYNLPYFVGAVVAIACTILTIVLNTRFVLDLVFHFCTANYLVLALLAGLLPSIDFFKDTKQGEYERNKAMNYGVGCGVVVLVTVAKFLLNRNSPTKEDLDQDSEIEMADPEVGVDKNSNPLLRESSDTLTSNPLWALSQEPKLPGEDEEEAGEG